MTDPIHKNPIIKGTRGRKWEVNFFCFEIKGERWSVRKKQKLFFYYRDVFIFMTTNLLTSLTSIIFTTFLFHTVDIKTTPIPQPHYSSLIHHLQTMPIHLFNHVWNPSFSLTETSKPPITTLHFRRRHQITHYHLNNHPSHITTNISSFFLPPATTLLLPSTTFVHFTISFLFHYSSTLLLHLNITPSNTTKHPSSPQINFLIPTITPLKYPPEKHHKQITIVYKPQSHPISLCLNTISSKPLIFLLIFRHP